ncbi:MAG: hypothetical protein H0V74_07455 [Chloroflexi bacterium]|nr:hypothetical protein [Chloroflexota bacterium]
MSNSGALSSALSSSAQDIVLENGTYDNAAYFVNSAGHRLYARTLGGAVLRAGLVMGGNWGPGQGLVQGIAFDVTDRAKTIGGWGDIIHIWGTGVGSRVLDTTFDGHGVMRAAVMGSQSDGLVIQRVRAGGFTDYGVLADGSPGAVTPVLFEDLNVWGVTRQVPRSANGTAEACIWLGNPGTLRRALVRDCAWMGVWIGEDSRNALIEHLDIDGTPVGIYPEHYSWGAVIQYFRIGPAVERGINCEWNDPATGGLPACADVTIQDGTIDSTLLGVALNPGTTRTTVRRVTFRSQSKAAIGDNGPDNAYYDNDYPR